MYDTRIDNRKLNQHLLHLQHLATENNMMWIVFIAHNINKAVYSQYCNLVYVYNLNLFFCMEIYYLFYLLFFIVFVLGHLFMFTLVIFLLFQNTMNKHCKLMNLVELEQIDIDLNVEILAWPRKMLPVFKKCYRVITAF